MPQFGKFTAILGDDESILAVSKFDDGTAIVSVGLNSTHLRRDQVQELIAVLDRPTTESDDKI